MGISKRQAIFLTCITGQEEAIVSVSHHCIWDEEYLLRVSLECVPSCCHPWQRWWVTCPLGSARTGRGEVTAPGESRLYCEGWTTCFHRGWKKSARKWTWENSLPSWVASPPLVFSMFSTAFLYYWQKEMLKTFDYWDIWMELIFFLPPTYPKRDCTILF